MGGLVSRAGLAATVLLVAAFAAPAARAQATPDAVAAEALFREGRRLIQLGRFAEACERLERSEKLDAAIGTLFSLGECYEAQARRASAWFAYREAETLAARRKDDRRLAAQSKAADLEPRLSRLAVRLADPHDAVQVSVDGQPVAAAALDVPLPVDPGPHHVEARLDRSYETTVEVSEGAGTVEVVIPSLARGGGALAHPSDWRRPVGVGLVGAGAAAAVAGGVLGLQAIVKARDVRDQCGAAPTCANVSAVHEYGQGATLADVSSVLIPVGLAAAAAGIVVLVSAHGSIEPVVGPGTARIDARWSW